MEALNGSTVLLPCTYASCIGIKNLYFNWQYNDNGTMQKVGQNWPGPLKYNSHTIAVIHVSSDVTQIGSGLWGGQMFNCSNLGGVDQ